MTSFRIGILLIALFALGAGCSSSTEALSSRSSRTQDTGASTPTQTESAQQNEADIPKDVNDAPTDQRPIVLNYNREPIQNPVHENQQIITFVWKATDAVNEQAEGWLIAYDGTDTPTKASAVYNYVRGPFHHELTWDNTTLWETLPAGKASFRVCALINNECAIYSNTITVDVLGPTEITDPDTSDAPHESLPIEEVKEVVGE